jgi:CheY-like chemotaxis protein
MPIITIFSAYYCNEEEIAKVVSDSLQYDLLMEGATKTASERFGVSVEKLNRAMGGSVSIFNNFTREKEKNLVYIRAALAQIIKQDNIIYVGKASHLIPKSVSHTMRVCLTADKEYRIATALKHDKSLKTEKDAEKAIAKADYESGQWTQEIFNAGPWDKNLYDIKLPMHKVAIDEAVNMICEYAKKDVVQSTDKSISAVDDFVLASEANVLLARHGHFDVTVTCKDRVVTVFINKHVLRLEHLSQELKTIALKTPDIKDVIVKVGPNFYKADTYRQQTFERPQKVLLVDDETDYVQTLSERLQMREFGTAVAYNGEEAISMVKVDEPEVMVLDLRMPGIDGMEVLRKLKNEHPEVEVIILTGHGTEQDQELAMQLGAFAYLEKPVDIEKLSQIMKEAYQKVQGQEDNAIYRKKR